jgi:membrane protein YqaA with SNARE-associated domain
MLELAGLFAAAFLSATLLPGSSEVALAAALASGRSGLSEALIVATIGNTLGSCVNWALGLFVTRWRGSRFFPVKDKDYERYRALYQRYGLWSLLASWVPIIGDPLTVMAGIFRTPLIIFVPIVAFAKLVRYLMVAGVVSWMV